MREIATAVGLRNQASLYHHFRNKRALYEAVLARDIEPILELAAQGATDVAVGATLVDRLVAHLAANPHLPRLIQRVGLEDRRYLPRVVPRVIGPLYAEGLRVLKRSSRPWKTRELPHLAVALYLLIFGYFANAPLIEAVLDIDPMAEDAVRRQQAVLRRIIDELLWSPTASS